MIRMNVLVRLYQLSCLPDGMHASAHATAESRAGKESTCIEARHCPVNTRLLIVCLLMSAMDAGSSSDARPQV